MMMETQTQLLDARLTALEKSTVGTDQGDLQQLLILELNSEVTDTSPLAKDEKMLTQMLETGASTAKWSLAGLVLLLMEYQAPALRREVMERKWVLKHETMAIQMEALDEKQTAQEQ